MYLYFCVWLLYELFVVCTGKTSKKSTKKKHADPSVLHKPTKAPTKDTTPSVPSRERTKSNNVLVEGNPSPAEHGCQVFSVPAAVPPAMQCHLPRPPAHLHNMDPRYAVPPTDGQYAAQSAALYYPIRLLGHPSHAHMAHYNQGYSPQYSPPARGSLSPSSSNVSPDCEPFSPKAHCVQSQWPAHPPGPGIFIQGGFITLPVSHLNNMGLGSLLGNPGPPRGVGGSVGYPPQYPTPQYYPHPSSHCSPANQPANQPASQPPVSTALSPSQPPPQPPPQPHPQHNIRPHQSSAHHTPMQNTVKGNMTLHIFGWFNCCWLNILELLIL